MGHMRNRIIWAGALLALAHALPALSGVTIQATVLGTPRESNAPGARSMQNWGSAAVRVVSDGGPILSVDFGSIGPTGFPRGIYGPLGQRWTSSLANGVYDVPSAGPANFTNAQSELSFDSHFLGTSGVDRIFTIEPSEGNIQFPGLNPISNTPAIGYGHGAFPGDLTTTGFLKSQFDLPSSAQAVSVPLAYLTFGGGISLDGRVVTTDGGFIVSQFLLFPSVPEPHSLFAVASLVGIVVWARHRR